MTQFIDVNRPPPGTFRKFLKMAGNDLRRGIVGWQHTLPRGTLRSTFNRSLPFDPVQEYERENPVASLVEQLRACWIQQLCFAGVSEDIAGSPRIFR
jgi:hypothetical protein